MGRKGRPKKNSNNMNLWIVEQYYHGDGLTQSWGKPIKICTSDIDAKSTMKLEAALYAADIENALIDDSLDKIITVKPNKGENFAPFMDFWYYQVTLIDPDE